MEKVKLVTIQESELRELIRQEAARAINEALSNQSDELLRIDELCRKIPGLTRYRFDKLKTEAKLKNIRGRYSLKSVKAAMQSQLR
ncbi:hypothetical protein [Acinetobacter radioresistens]|uniref:hypothetical protein n=1 Tax=Acinetobacter radioresistens TaxID=40216 RepID=UPI00224504D4|nr:hypothetical protein [Acinetobacter radioresistens]MCX0334186.1 hypothetical protein [Acinetobacter radioresistens]